MGMETISVAIAMQSGEMASRLIETVNSHPLLDFCGAARSLPDLLRLLDRFRPMVLLVSTSMMEEMEYSAQAGAARPLSAPLTFLVSSPEVSWSEKELARALSLPLRYCGLIDRNGHGAEDLFHRIKQKVDLFSLDELPLQPARNEKMDVRRSNAFIALAGSKGGVGGTLLSCVLASALASAGRRVLLLDMDNNLSQLLHLKPRNDGKTALDLFPMAEEISWDLVRVSVHHHAAGFHLLPYGLNSEDCADRRGRIPDPFLRNLFFLFDVVVMDFPRPLRKEFLPLLHHSPTLLLVCLADTLSANCARITAGSLRRHGLDPRRLFLVVNRYGSGHALRPHELARAAGAELLACLPEDERSGLDFAELGEVPKLESPLGRAAAEMAYSLGYEVALAPKTGALQRLKVLRRREDEGLPSGERS
jgi:MinD-like ATPase involved in chromosome partitioning or flagellar assembly